MVLQSVLDITQSHRSEGKFSNVRPNTDTVSQQQLTRFLTINSTNGARIFPGNKSTNPFKMFKHGFVLRMKQTE